MSDHKGESVDPGAVEVPPGGQGLDGPEPGAFGDFLRTQWALLRFRPSPIARQDQGIFLVFAMGITWLAGVWRYWDHPSADWWQYAGLGSVAYVFALSLLLWVTGLPLKPRGWSYSSVLLFVCMTSAPALLYAIPVERFMPLTAAQSTNFWFLVVVAVWRVALLFRHLGVAAGLGKSALIVALLPMCGILLLLSALNLEHATFEIMAQADTVGTPHDGAYQAVLVLTFLATVAAIPLLLAYVVLWYDRQVNPKSKSAAKSGELS